MGYPPDGFNAPTVPRSPDKVKCNAATPADNSAPNPLSVLFMAADAL
jgi:hypothetical protein